MQISERLSLYLDFVRALAAGAVVLNHVRSYMFVEYTMVSSKDIFDQLFYFLTGFGHEAVMIFFVLSGYLVGGKGITSIRDGEFQVRLYVINRLSRIYPVFLAALVLGFALDTVGLNLLNGAGLYNGTYVVDLNSPIYSAAARLDIGTALANVLMLQTVIVPPLGTNLPLWSLAYEFWYYVLFPIVALLMLRDTGMRCKPCWYLVVILLVFVLPHEMILYSSIWCIGALMGLVTKRLLPSFTISICLLAVSLVIVRSNIVTGYTSDMIIALVFSLTINSLVGNKHKANSAIKTLSKWLSNFSYSLYAIHYPLMVFLLSWSSYNLDVLGQQPSRQVYVLFALMIAFIYIPGFLFSVMIERRTTAIRNALIRLYQSVSKTQF